MRPGVTTQIQRTAGWRGAPSEGNTSTYLCLQLNRRLADVPNLQLSVVRFATSLEVTVRTLAGSCMTVVPHHRVTDAQYLDEVVLRLRQLLDEASKPAA